MTRKRMLQIRCTDEELAVWENCAKESKMTLSVWGRRKLTAGIMNSMRSWKLCTRCARVGKPSCPTCIKENA